MTVDMNHYDNEYYFIVENNTEGLPAPSPDRNTENRRFRYEEQIPGSAPLGFENGLKDFQREQGRRAVNRPPRIMLEGSNPMVPLSVRDELIRREIPGLFTHHAYYVHDDGKWFEDYWYLAFGERFDCWDRKSSDYSPDPIELGGFTLYSIYKFSLNQKLLDETPIQQRLLFQMGSCQDAYFVCHESIAHLFRTDEKVQGVRLVKVADY